MTRYSGGGDMTESGIFTYCFLGAIAGIFVLALLFMNGTLGSNGTSSGSMRNRKKGRMSPQYLGSTPGKQVLTGPIADNRPRPALMMAPHQLDNYMNLVYPPSTTTFKPGADGVSQCAVSTVNNCPSDLYYKCNQKAWSKEAIGEALALSSVGSYYLPSAVEEENLHKVVSLAHDPVSAACANAGNVKPYTGSNPNLVGAMSGV